MPHASGVNDKVGVLGAEIADMETQRDALKEQIARSEETIAVWIAGIEDNTTRLVFRLRFIRGMPWKVEVCLVGEIPRMASSPYVIASSELAPP